MDVQLQDLLGSYPFKIEKGIQTLTTSKREFIELASRSDDTILKVGEYFKHQELIARLLLMVDMILLFHQTGTGKTCAFIRAAEYFRQLRVKEDPRGVYKRTYILVKGPQLTKEIKYQILCKCTGERYVTDLIKNAKTERARRHNISLELKKFYSIQSYTKFGNRIIGKVGEQTKIKHPERSIPMTDEDIIREFSNSIFIVDEVHNLRIDPKVGSNDEELKNSYIQLNRIFHLAKNIKVILASATPMINSPGEIGPIMNLILPKEEQFDENFNFNKATLQDLEPYFRGRISYVRSLDIGLDIQYIGEPLDATFDIDGREIRAETIIYPSKMIEVEDEEGNQFGQLVTYEKVKKENEGKNFYIPVREAADFVYPDGSYGSVGFNRYIVKRGADYFIKPDPQKIIKNKDGSDTVITLPPLSTYLSDISEIEWLSAKFATIVQLCMEAKGKCFVFLDYAELGAVPLGLCFEGQGFRPFTEGYSIFQSKGESRLSSPCNLQGIEDIDDQEEETDKKSNKGKKEKKDKMRKKSRSVRFDFPEAKRYSLLMGGVPDTRIESMMETFNSPENFNGEYIKVMIGSPAARDGINLSEVKEIHIASGGWNASARYQAESRGIRATSHQLSLAAEKNKIIEKNKLIDNDEEILDPEFAKVVVKIYNHASVDNDGQSIDTELYRVSEEKSFEIKRIERFMKQCALDCQIHYQRNTRYYLEEVQAADNNENTENDENTDNDKNTDNDENDENNENTDENENIQKYQIRSMDRENSAACDYQECLYKCVEPAPWGFNPDIYTYDDIDILDTETYDVFYADEVVIMIIYDLNRIFKNRFSVSLNELYQGLLSKYKEKFIDYAVVDAITKRIPFTDRYGVTSYLQSSGNVVYLTRDPLIKSKPAIESQIDTDYLLTTYTSTLIGNEFVSLDDYVGQLESEEQLELIEKLKDIDPRKNSNEFSQIIDELNLDNRVRLLEEAYKLYAERKESLYINSIINKFKQYIYQVREPVALINKTVNAMVEKSQGPGKKAGPDSKIIIDSISDKDLKKDRNQEIVYFHNLYIKAPSQIKHGKTSRSIKGEGKIRIFKPSEQIGWRDPTRYEAPVYGEIIRLENKKRFEPFEKFDIYGIVIDEAFQIRNKLAEKGKSSDARSERRGKNCTSFQIQELIEILYHLEIKPSPPPKMKINEMKKYLSENTNLPEFTINTLSKDQLSDYIGWYLTKPNKDDLCDLIYLDLNQKERILFF